MATKKKNGTDVEEIVSKSEQFIENHSKHLLYGVLVVAAVVALILGVKHGYLAPREKKAAVALFKGEQYFAKDSFALALNGNGADYEGFEAIIDQYGSTKAGNLAKAYAGISRFKLGQLDEALKDLKSFGGGDNMVSPALVGLIGDCYVNLGETEKGISYFEKAAKQADNEVVSPVYLKKAGIAYESLQQYKDAAKVYTAIKEKYYTSTEASDIEKYITRANELASK
ncbi:Tetratricopeptide repeat [Bacteroidales bacterium Barb6XT]|nr:Tetratricopeptide repeat [Bacteroidales bacterium Barb6XT]